jgi:hypothetical protein
MERQGEGARSRGGWFGSSVDHARLRGVGWAAGGCATSAALLLGACAPDPGEVAGGVIPGIAGPNLRLAAALVPFDACDDLLAHLQAEALERVGPYGLDGGPWGGPVPLAARGDVQFEAVGGFISADGADAPTSISNEPRAYEVDEQATTGTPTFSTTNVQEIGVDEPDLVKTDGERIVTVAGDRLLVLLGADDRAEVVGELHLPGWGGQLLLRGDTALVILTDGTFVSSPAGAVDERVAMPDSMPAPTGVRLVEVDLSDPERPRIADEVSIEGQHVASRMIDGTARVVVRSTPASFEFVYPSGPGAEDAAEAANRSVIEASTIDDWLPAAQHDRGPAERLVACEAMRHPKEFAGFTTVSVLSFQVGGGLDDLAAVGVLADAEHVYASSQSLYVSTSDYVEPVVRDDVTSLPAPSEDFGTDLHKFDLSGDGQAVYRASGEVRGHLLNQFAMSEHDGVLRVATTDGAPWGCCGESSSESFVTTFEERAGELVPLGEAGGLGKGEQIYAVRFIGDAGYVVTFRQTDPLYVLDLRDPRRPAVTGELKIPGYSAYLHPLGDGLLLGVGQDGTDDGRLTGSAVSLFDVSDPSDPRRLAIEPLGDGTSQIELDHHAFLWWAPEDLAVVPLQTWGPAGHSTGAVGLRIEGSSIQRVLQVVNDSSGLRPRPEPEPEPTPTTAPTTTVDATTTTVPPPTTTLVPPSTTEPPPLPTTTIDDPAGISLEEASVIAPEPYPATYTEPIQRSFVVGDLLYTWSPNGLAVTWLPTLEKVDWIRF